MTGYKYASSSLFELEDEAKDQFSGGKVQGICGFIEKQKRGLA